MSLRTLEDIPKNLSFDSPDDRLVSTTMLKQEAITWIKEIRNLYKILEDYDKDVAKELLRESLRSNSIVRFITDDDTYSVRCGMRNRLLGMEKAFMDFFNLSEDDLNG